MNSYSFNFKTHQKFFKSLLSSNLPIFEESFKRFYLTFNRFYYGTFKYRKLKHKERKPQNILNLFQVI